MTITETKKLSQLLSLTEIESEEVFTDFPLQVPESFVRRMAPKDANDPLLLQVLPQQVELKESPGFITDPLAEKSHTPIAGLIHKYPDRVLLLTTDVCAINCRFCFRRHLHDIVTDWQQVFVYIESHPDISEVILSGGDPLMLSSNKLLELIDSLAKISHLERLRIHSRVPIVMPQHVIPKLTKTRLSIILVVHCNHPNEINADIEQGIASLRQTGATVLNQSVLLRGINDNADTLSFLSKKLFKIGVLPYYLHLLDKVKGAAHFYVDKDRAKQIHLKMQTQLPGYLVPKLVVEINNRKIYV